MSQVFFLLELSVVLVNSSDCYKIIYVSLYLYLYLSIHPSICLSIYLSIYIYMCVCVYVCVLKNESSFFLVGTFSCSCNLFRLLQNEFLSVWAFIYSYSINHIWRLIVRTSLILVPNNFETSIDLLDGNTSD